MFPLNMKFCRSGIRCTCSVADESASAVLVIVTVLLEVIVFMMVELILEVEVRDALGAVLVIGREFLVVCFFFGELNFFQRCTLFVILLKYRDGTLCISKDNCISFRGNQGGFAVFNSLGDFFFVIVSFASSYVAFYAVLLADFLEVLGNDVFGWISASCVNCI